MSTLSLFPKPKKEPRLTWFSQPVKRYTGTVEYLCQHIPTFTRSDFNAYLDQITRQPLKDDEGEIPVATVSKQYALIQHHEVIDAVQSGLKAVGFKPDALAADLRLSDYGERMHLRLMLVNDTFDPGDGNVLGIALNCLNSVDRSTALELSLTWHRLVCDNGMYLTDSDKMRRVHLGSIGPEDIADYLKTQLSEMEEDKRRLTSWYGKPVTISKVEMWADETVAKRWGVFLAARTCHISRTGFDGEVLGAVGKVPPRLRQVSSQRQVPGACAPVTNAYHVSQVLSWLARERNTVQDQFEKMLEIPALINPLLN
jgi:hypothetical protein